MSLQQESLAFCAKGFGHASKWVVQVEAIGRSQLGIGRGDLCPAEPRYGTSLRRARCGKASQATAKRECPFPGGEGASCYWRKLAASASSSMTGLGRNITFVSPFLVGSIAPETTSELPAQSWRRKRGRAV